jgi:putative transcriptional regulator
VSEGSFYIIRLAPDIAPRRVKLGWAKDVGRRLAIHRCTAPTATVVQTWPCPREHEAAAIRAITAVGCRRLSREVFVCAGLRMLTRRADAFFAGETLLSAAPPTGPVLKNRLSRPMGERRIGIKDVAEGSGVSYRAVFDLYHEKSQRVDLSTLNRLCNFFEVGPGEIFEWTPDARPGEQGTKP